MESKIINYIRTFFLLKRKGVKFGKIPFIFGQMPLLTNKGNISVGDEFTMRNYQFKSEITCADNAELIMGNEVGINQGSNIYAAESVHIGDNVLIGDCVKIYDTNFHSMDVDSTIIRPVKIGNNVWIGVHSIILPGVTIGENSVIGAGSVVTKSIPSNYFAAGSPAKLIKKHESTIIRSPRKLDRPLIKK
jgi:acetyltransferase-like isoleucine patch superfamily enzyme